ncbi:hypothetical protein ElyMa_003507200 [Elysia marginata]|uniref:Uncharacterized protein n=1 Tax=Elysia marginata TaxID=1093978 RepID=A0AAV4EGP8_9GAST|nr:hypothetical protein ElyMa_003507200 [Elysia marginata]
MCTVATPIRIRCVKSDKEGRIGSGRVGQGQQSADTIPGPGTAAAAVGCCSRPLQFSCDGVDWLVGSSFNMLPGRLHTRHHAIGHAATMSLPYALKRDSYSLNERNRTYPITVELSNHHHRAANDKRFYSVNLWCRRINPVSHDPYPIRKTPDRLLTRV